MTSTAGRFAPFQFISDAYEAVLALARADFTAAEAAAEQAEARATADSAPYDEGVYGLQMYAIRRAEGRLAEVAPVMRALATSADPPSTWRPGLAALYTDLGMLDDAAVVFEALAPDGFAVVPRDAVWPASLTFLAETCVALGDQAHASVLYDELIPFRGHNLMAGMTICFGPADRLLGGLAALLGRAQEAEEHFRVALELAERSASPLWTAEVQYDWATVLTAHEPERAREIGEQAIATAKQHGIGRLLARAVPGDGDDTAAPATPPLPDHLSEREAEVLRLVATGSVQSRHRCGAVHQPEHRRQPRPGDPPQDRMCEPHRGVAVRHPPRHPRRLSGQAGDALGSRGAVTGGRGHGAAPLAIVATAAKVSRSRCWRMCSPASFQIAINTHWPSWSHAPSWWGSPKSPSVIGPSTAATISDRRIAAGSRASTYPPPTPRLERTSPAPLRASRICSR